MVKNTNMGVVGRYLKGKSGGIVLAMHVRSLLFLFNYREAKLVVLL